MQVAISLFAALAATVDAGGSKAESAPRPQGPESEGHPSLLSSLLSSVADVSTDAGPDRGATLLVSRRSKAVKKQEASAPLMHPCLAALQLASKAAKPS